MTDQQQRMIKKLLKKYKISSESLDKTLLFLGVGYGLPEEQIEQYLSLGDGQLLEKHTLMMSFAQEKEKSDADEDVDVQKTNYSIFRRMRRKKQKKQSADSNKKGKETYEDLSMYILNSANLSAAQIEQLRLAVSAGMPEKDVLKLAQGGKKAMEIRKCVEFYEMMHYEEKR